MAVQFNVLPNNTQVFLAPYVTLTATDTTDPVSAVSAWAWFYNETLVGTQSSWSYTYFDPAATTRLLLSASTPQGSFVSSAVYITIQEPWPAVLAFDILPSNNIEMPSSTKSIVITARDVSPALSSVSAWAWTFNGVSVGNQNTWNYTFFDPITGTVGLTLDGAFGTSTLASQTLTITRPRENACGKPPVLPEGIRGSTTLSPIITSYELMAQRIKMMLGWPVVNIEMCDDQIYDFINQACEYYSKYAGHSEEYLVFDSCNYKAGVGLKVDNIINRLTDFYGRRNCDTISPEITGQYYDCDVNNYRKIVGIFQFNPAGGGYGNSGTGTEVLFNMDYMFAQQAYFGQMMGGMGYDLVTWHLLKSWLKDRQRLFATETYVNFEPKSQLLRLTPEPGTRMGSSTYTSRFVGVIGCRMERSIAEMVSERWVQHYALALTKITLGHIRGKFGGVVLFGGANVNPQDIMSQGSAEKERLEKEIMEGWGEAEPALFFHG